MTTTSEHEHFPIQEEKQEKLEVHVASVCIRVVGGRPQVLVARRTATHSLFPGKWECGGGMVRPGESFDAAIQRQIFEEFGLEIDRVRVLEVYEIPLPKNLRQPIIPGVRFLCLAKVGKSDSTSGNSQRTAGSICLLRNRWIGSAGSKKPLMKSRQCSAKIFRTTFSA